MRRRVFAALVITGALAAPAAAQQNLTSPSISTEGRASVKASPDIAWLTVTADARAPKTAEAQRQSAAAIEAVKSSLRQAGVADAAVKTRSYSVEPQMQYTDGKSKVIGYIARHSLDVEVTDLTKLGAIVDAAGASGATSISDIRYDVKDRAAIESQLLIKAVQDGLHRASAMAVGAGKEVGSVWRIDEQRFSANSPQPMYRVQAGVAMDAPTSVTPGDLEIRAQVLVTVIIR